MDTYLESIEKDYVPFDEIEKQCAILLSLPALLQQELENASYGHLSRNRICILHCPLFNLKHLENG